MPKRPPLPRTRQLAASRITERWLGLIALLAGLVLAVAAILVRGSANESIDAEKLVAHSYQVLGETEQLRSSLAAAEAGQRGFILLGKPSALEPYQLARFSASLHLAALRPLTYGTDDQYSDVLRLEPLITRRFEYLSRSIDTRQDAGLDAARKMLEADPGSNTIEPIETMLGTIERREQRRLQEAHDRQERASDRGLIIMVTTLTLLTILSLVFWGFLKREFLVRHRLEEALLESAISDELTGAINRSEFERLLGQEWSFRQRYGTPLSIVLIDLDNLDEISSAFGLRAGDAILRDVVRRLRGRLRSTERLARYGGHQLALLVPQPLGSAVQLARQLVELVSGSPYPVRNAQNETQEAVEVVLCIGVADASDVEDESELVQAAGHALYIAKASGQNRVEPYRVTLPNTVAPASATTTGA